MSGWDEPQSNGLSMRDSQILATGKDPLNPQPEPVPTTFAFPGPDAPSSSAATARKGGVFYPILVIGITWFTLYYTGLIHTAFTTNSNLFQAGAIIAIAGFFLTPAGRNFAMVAITGLVVFVVGTVALLVALQHFGVLTAPNSHSTSANVKHASVIRTHGTGHRKHHTVSHT